MKIKLLYIVSVFLLISCSENKTKHSDLEEGEMSTDTLDRELTTDNYEDDGFTEAEMNEHYKTIPPIEIYNELQDGNFSAPKDIINQLKIYCSLSDEDDLYFKSITKKANGSYTKACEYNEVGNYSIFFNEKDERAEIVKGKECVILQHDYQDPTLYLVEEVIISEKGKKTTLKVRYITLLVDGYDVDMSISIETFELIRIENKQVIMIDRALSESNQRYFVLLNQHNQLPEPDCEENYH